MPSFSRFIKIFYTLAKHRVDDLLPERRGDWRLFLLRRYCAFYPRGKLDRGERLRLALEALGPIFVKFGQLLSTRPDLVPADIIGALNQLQDNVTPFDNDDFRELVESALGQPVGEVFAEFDHMPLASASVAQVHAARLENGEAVIVKAVRPGIEHVIEQDTQLLLVLARMVEKLSPHGKRLRPVDVVSDYRTTIFDELDLSLEAANASQLRRNYEHSEQLYIPKIYWEYTRSNVLVMERIYGIPVTDITQLKSHNINIPFLAERGVEIFFTQVFEHNFFHADMHPGNVFVSRENPEKPSYIAVDMAIMGSLTREDQYYLARNLLAMFRRDYRQVAELHVSSGWVPPETSVSAFEAAIRAVCEPVFEKPLKDISFGEALITIFRTAQRFNMPVQPQLVLLQKTLLNIEGLGRQLYPELNLWDTAHPFLELWMKKRFHPRTLWKEFRYNAPELIEKLPMLPHQVFDALTSQSRVAEETEKLVQLQTQMLVDTRERLRIRGVFAGILTLAGLVVSWPLSSGISTESLILFALAALCVLR